MVQYRMLKSQCTKNNHAWFLNNCQNSSDFTDSRFLPILKSCFPWIKATFPQCWKTYSNFSLGYQFAGVNQDECYTQCKVLNNACSMLLLFQSIGKCVHQCSNNPHQYCFPRDDVSIGELTFMFVLFDFV